MSFEELAKRTAGTPEAAAHAAARSAEAARKPFHDAFLADVYPHWQGPLNTIARKPGIEGPTHAPMPGSSPFLFPADARRPWVLSEVITAGHASGVRAIVAYTFGGDVNDGTMVRSAGFGHEAATTQDHDLSKQWTGPLARLIEAAVGDVDEAAALFGTLLVAALDAKEAAAEKARLEVEEKAEAELARAATAERER